MKRKRIRRSRVRITPMFSMAGEIGNEHREVHVPVMCSLGSTMIDRPLWGDELEHSDSVLVKRLVGMTPLELARQYFADAGVTDIDSVSMPLHRISFFSRGEKSVNINNGSNTNGDVKYHIEVCRHCMTVKTIVNDSVSTVREIVLPILIRENKSGRGIPDDAVLNDVLSASRATGKRGFWRFVNGISVQDFGRSERYATSEYYILMPMFVPQTLFGPIPFASSGGHKFIRGFIDKSLCLFDECVSADELLQHVVLVDFGDNSKVYPFLYFAVSSNDDLYEMKQRFLDYYDAMRGYHAGDCGHNGCDKHAVSSARVVV